MLNTIEHCRPELEAVAALRMPKLIFSPDMYSMHSVRLIRFILRIVYIDETEAIIIVPKEN